MQRRHRIFIAINLPREVKKVLGRYQEKWPELPAKWTPAENLHITLLFLGDVTDEEMGDICLTVKEVSQRHSILDVTLNKVGYGPDNKIPPRMVWASGDLPAQAGKNKELSALKKDLEDSLEGKVTLMPEFATFSPHVTLARISAIQWRMIEPEERPEVSENVDFTFTVESIDVMESELKRGGPQYTIIESAQLSI
ncbi:MAG: RNA 2',3'-cyclic phosphodiesterase [bacterium]|nr:RNA 2',3'-cyclic phosphodiesterase [bacterium]